MSYCTILMYRQKGKWIFIHPVQNPKIQHAGYRSRGNKTIVIIIRRRSNFSFVLVVWLRCSGPSLLFWNRCNCVSPSAIGFVEAFHDCIQSRQNAIKRRRYRHIFLNRDDSSSYQGGICVGMTKGSHQGGNSSYPVAWNGTTGTRLQSTMTVPGYPTGTTTEKELQNITYYIWTDFFR